MKKTLAAAALAVASLNVAAPAAAQEFFMGQIIMGGWNFCPRGTLNANGALVAISDNTALFSLLGTSFGGNGRTDFALPDLRGRVPMGAGNGPGLTPRNLGQKGGAESVNITTNQMPSHSHSVTATLNGVVTPGSSPNPAGNLLGLTTTSPAYAPAGGAPAAFDGGAITATETPVGGGEAVAVQDPYQVITYCIVNQIGIYPSRN